MSSRNDCLLDKGYALDPALDSTKPLFEGAVAVVSTTGAIPQLSVGDPNLFGIVRPDDALAYDGGYAYCGIVDVGGFTGSPLFNQSAGSVNLPLPQDKFAKLQLLGFAKCKGLPSTQFNFGEDVGFLPSYGQNAAAQALGGGWIVPLRLFPGARPIGVCRSTILTSGLTLSGGVIQHQQSSDFVTVELHQGTIGKSLRVIGNYLGDSTALTGAALGANTEGAFGTDGQLIPSNDVAQVRVYGNMLRVGSLLEVEAQVRFTAQAGADTAICRLRYGGLTGALLASTGPTKVYAAGDVATLKATLLVVDSTHGILPTAYGIIGTPSGIAAQTCGGAAKVTLPAITSDRMIVATLQFSANAAGDTAVLESLTARIAR